MKGHRRAFCVAVAVAAIAATEAVMPVRAPAAEKPWTADSPAGPLLPQAVAALLQEAAQQPDTENLMLAQFSPRRHKGYAASILAFKEKPSARTRLTVSFNRSTLEGTQTQSSTFGWTLPKRALRMGRDLNPSSLRTGRAMGGNGRISMKLSGRSRFVRLRNPGDCTGSISYRAGRFDGTFRLDARDEHFGKMRFARTRVGLYRADDLRCPPEPGAPPCPSGLSLSAVDAESGVAVGAFRTPEGRVDQSVVVVGSSGRAKTTHLISVTIAAPDAFEASDDLTTASIDGDAAAPLLTGDLDYIAPPPAAEAEDDCGTYRSTAGLATGDYTAHFDSIGSISPASPGLEATLRREDP
jgi:hypothetical protein